ncbi:hypothetical protein NA57DRAFT_20055, partial [Rhizodiscina lignyota]
SKRRRTHSPQNSSSREYGLMRDGTDRGRPRFLGSASGIHFIRAVYDALARRPGGPYDHQSPQENLVPGEDDQLREQSQTRPSESNLNPENESHFWRVDEVLSGDTFPLLPGFDQLIDWSRSYFENWHPLFPFLHAPSTLRYFEQISLNGIRSLPAAHAVVVRSVISISLADARQSTTKLAVVPANLVFRDAEDLVSQVQFALFEPASLQNVQALVVAQLLLVSQLRFNFASRLGGLILRMALHLGLHRCPARYSNFNPEESQLRQRVFWSIYCIERMLCQSLGLPLDIQDDDVDVCYIGQELHKLQPGTWSENNGSSTYQQLRLLTFLVKHAKIRGLILELRNKSLSVRRDTFERTMAVQVELAKWANDIYDVVESNTVGGLQLHTTLNELPNPNRNTITPAHRLVLQILQHEATITLNRPLITELGSSAALAALQNCITASRSIINSLDSFRVQHISADTPFQDALSTPMVWPLLTWSVWMSCFILTYAALEGHLSVPSALRYADKTLLILQHLSRRQTTWPDSCADAVRQLMTAL